MSYGLMIAYSLTEKIFFDRLWRWCKNICNTKKVRRRLFRLSCKTDGTRNAQGPASDGELYYVTSLIFASNSWGNDSDINYLERHNILNCSMKKRRNQSVMPLINMEHKLITFVPDTLEDDLPTLHHVPAFMKCGPAGQTTEEPTSGENVPRVAAYLHKSIHPVTGPIPITTTTMAAFLTYETGIIGDAFRFDSWRVPMNIALDYSWACADKEWQQVTAIKFKTFVQSRY